MKAMLRRRGRRRRLLASFFFAATATAAVVFVAARPSEADLLDLPPLPPPPPSQKHRPAEVCFVVRTYRKHGEEERGGEKKSLHSPPPLPPLARLLRSLKAQTNPKWVALLLVADEDPFLDLEEIIGDALGGEEEGIRGGRAWVWARSSGPEHRAKEEVFPSSWNSSSSSRSRWVRGFHRALFSLTDDAIQWGCPQSSKLVVVTNGDNAYAPRFVERALEEARGGRGSGGDDDGREEERRRPLPPFPADLVLFDYATRYANPAGEPCERFGARVLEAEESGKKDNSSRSGGRGVSSSSFRLPYCKRNLGRWCHTDLGAVAFRLSRLRGFGSEASPAAAAAAASSSSSSSLTSRPLPRRSRRRFRFMDAGTLAAAAAAGLSPDSLDGVFVEHLIQSGDWAVRRVGSGAEGDRDDPWLGGERREREEGSGGSSSSPYPFGECFFDHSPSPHACALSEGIWDDSAAATAEGAGGECLGEEEAEAKLLLAGSEAAAAGSSGSSTSLELVRVRVLSRERAPLLRCLRWRDAEAHRRAMRAFFGGRCAEEG